MLFTFFMRLLGLTLFNFGFSFLGESFRTVLGIGQVLTPLILGCVL